MLTEVQKVRLLCFWFIGSNLGSAGGRVAGWVKQRSTTFAKKKKRKVKLSEKL